MQTTKFHFVLSLMAALVAPALTCVAGDTPEQIKAREALRQKMNELDTSSTTPKPAPPAAPPQAVAPAAAPPKKAPAPVFAPVPPPSPAPRPAPVPTFAPVPETAGASTSEFGPVPNAVEDANTVRLQQALRQEMAVHESTPAAARKPVKSGQAPVFTESVVSASPILQVPVSPVTGAKAARLAELLQRYNANQVTPKEYHIQRAAILAEP